MAIFETKEAGALSVGNGPSMIGVRPVEVCSCGKPDCARVGMAAELCTLISMGVAKEALDCDCPDDHPVMLLTFVNAAEARALAVRLLEIADQADPPLKKN